MKAAEIRKKARENLKGRWNTAILVSLIYMVILTLLEVLTNESKGWISFLYTIVSLAGLAVLVPINVGYLWAMMQYKREIKIKPFGFLQEGFQNFKKIWKITFRILGKILPWFILLIVFAFALVIGYIQLMISGFFIALQSSETINYTATIQTYLCLMIVGMIGYLAMIVAMVPKCLLYAFYYFIAYDQPEKSAKFCVEKSETMMRGNRWRLFCLYCSFWGWVLLVTFIYSLFVAAELPTVINLLVFCIGMALLMPYITASFVIFYEQKAPVQEVKQNKSKKKKKEDDNIDPIQNQE